MSSLFQLPPHGSPGLTRKVFGRLSSFLPRMFNAFWIVACIMLAGAAVYNLTQLSQLKQEVSARRLLEASMQDLLVQSTAMRYLSIEDNQELTEK
ncbi:MAG: hypothetical protein R3194_07735, partial [Limnobacter sp.]|nr:hypothetical protein [Limnobacter sp.]